MSILGKVLVFLNVLAAIAFVYLATVDFAKRQHWTYALYRHDLRIKGLPLTEDETDREGHVLTRNLDPKTLQELFPGSAPQVKSQMDEVNRVRQQVQGDIESTTAITVSNPYIPDDLKLKPDDPKLKLELKTKLQKLAWALRPLVDLPTRRQANDVKAHEAMAGRYEMLTRLMTLPDDQPLVLDGLFTSDVETELMKLEPSKRRQQVAERLEQDFNQAFDELNGMNDREAKRRATAHLLLGLAELSVDKATLPGKDRNLIADPEYRRALAVVGLEAAVREMDSQAKDLAAMAEGVSRGMGRDRNLFAVQHAALVPRLLEMADACHDVRAELERKKNEVVTQEELVKVRRQEIEKLESKLGERQKATRALLDKQTRLEKTLFKAQQDFRDAADENHKLEREIGTLEKGR